MSLLVVVLGAFCLLALALAWKPSPRFGLAVTAVAVVLALGAGARWQSERDAGTASMDTVVRAIPVQGSEEDLVTSDTCRSCHPGEYASWHRTYHRSMTQPATPETVRGDWTSGKIPARGWDYHLERRGDEFWVEMVDPDWERVNRLRGAELATAEAPRVERRVVMTTGSHHMQTYWVPSQFENELLNLPFVYLFEEKRWIPREDVFLRPPEAPPFLDIWNDNCIECHSTVGVPGFDFEAEKFTTRASEIGISCEACHGPGEEHVRANRDPRRRYRLHAANDGDPTMVQPERLDHEASSQVCGQCHGVALSDAKKWLAEGPSYRAGGDLEASRFMVLPAQNSHHPRLRRLVENEPKALEARFWDDGEVRVSGREFTGMVESPCYQRGELSCLSCHSMHASDPDDQLIYGKEGDGACADCHPSYLAEISAHTRHEAGSSGSRCMNCHMPLTTYGLLKAMRSHTIKSPSVAATLQTGRPNACNLCHLDRTLEWTDEKLAKWYGMERSELADDERRVSSAVLQLLRGDAGQRALIANAMGWSPAVAASGGEDWLAPYLGHLLKDPYAAVRFISARSLRRLPGYDDFEYDFIAPLDDRLRGRDAAIRRWLEEPWQRERWHGSATLIAADGNLRVDEIGRLGSQRDDRPLFLGE